MFIKSARRCCGVKSCSQEVWCLIYSMGESQLKAIRMSLNFICIRLFAWHPGAWRPQQQVLAGTVHLNSQGHQVLFFLEGMPLCHPFIFSVAVFIVHGVILEAKITWDPVLCISHSGNGVQWELKNLSAQMPPWGINCTYEKEINKS